VPSVNEQRSDSRQGAIQRIDQSIWTAQYADRSTARSIRQIRGYMVTLADQSIWTAQYAERSMAKSTGQISKYIRVWTAQYVDRSTARSTRRISRYISMQSRADQWPGN
jgi:hypothetical protein